MFYEANDKKNVQNVLSPPRDAGRGSVQRATQLEVTGAGEDPTHPPEGPPTLHSREAARPQGARYAEPVEDMVGFSSRVPAADCTPTPTPREGRKQQGSMQGRKDH